MCGRLLFMAMCIFSAFSAYAQGEINNWFFGRYAGLNFNGGTPVVQTGQLNTLEGCASISDANGNLLFYTDGMRIWNRNHVIMANGSGLMGDPSSTSSSIIIPKPNSCDTFYVFTVDMQGGDAVGIGDADNASRGLRYSEIDMSANGGLGAVTTRKNIALLARTTEGLTAVRHGNGVDYWVITHGWRNGNNQRYFAYHVSPGGVNTSAVVSTAGPSLNTDEDGIGTLGYIKANKQGTRIATAHSFINNQLVITNFNNNTGVLSNAITMSVRSNGNSQGPYGVEFSPDGRYLYCTEQTSNSTYGYPIRSFIYRYDMTAGGIPGSRVTFASIADQFVASLQLGPDGNIYASSAERSGNGIIYGRYLHRINNPASPAATFTHSAIALAPGSSAYGLPTFPTGFNTMDFTVTSPITGTDVFCEKEYADFVGTSSVYDSIRWYFGDPSSGALNTSISLSPSHYYATAGNYEVVFIKHRCYRADTVRKTIYVRPLPVFNISDQTFCANEPVTLNPGISGDSYLWSNGSVSQTSSFGNSGTGWLTVTSNQCRYTDNFNLNSKTIPNVSAGSNLFMGCTNPTVQLNGSSTTPGVSFSWTGPGIVSDGGTATPTVNLPGTYILTVYDPVQDCSNTASVTVTQDITIPNADAGADIQLTCTTNSAVLNGTSSTPGVNYTWTGPNIVSGGNTATPTVNGAGTYILTITNPATNCSATDQLTVTQNGVAPDVNAGIDTALTCIVTTVVLNGSSSTGGVTYTWSGPNIVSGGNTTSPVINGAGTYTLTVTDPLNNCSSTDNIIVAQNNTPPDADAGIDSELSCTVNSITLNGTSSVSGANYTWSGPGIVSGDHTLTPVVNATGTYVLTVTNPANGCSATDDVDVIRNVTLPGADAGTDSELTCLSTTLTLNGSSTTTGVTYSWVGPGIVSDGNTANPVINVAGTYTLTVTNPDNGCTNTDNVLITLNNTAPNADAGSDAELTCAVTSVILNGTSATSGVTYTWTGPNIVSGGNTATPTVNAAGAYILTVTNPANGCTATDNVSVSQNIVAPDAEAGNGQTLNCLTASVVLNGSSSIAGITYSWSGPGIFSDGNSANPTINAAGTYTLTVTNPANGCTNTDNVIVNLDNTAPDADAGTGAALSCTITSISLNGSSATPGATYYWTGPGITSGQSTSTPIINTAGVYTLTVTNPANHCTATDNVTITQSDILPQVNAGTDSEITCLDPVLILNGSSTTSGVTYSWTGPGIVSDESTTTPTINRAGTYILTVTNPSNGCTNTDNVVITLNNTAPNADAGSDRDLTCAVTAVVLSGTSATSGVTYTWTGPNIVSGGNTAAPTINTAGTYTLTVTNPANGCTATDNVSVSQDIVAPDAEAGNGQTLTCLVTSVVLNGSSSTSGITYSWTGPGIVSDGNTANPTINKAGTYILTVTNPANDCKTTDNVSISQDTVAPNVNAGTDKILICSAVSHILDGTSSTAGISFTWSGPGFVSGSNTLSPTVNIPGEYELTVTNLTNGCQAADKVVVTQNITPPSIEIMNDTSINCTIPSIRLSVVSSVSNSAYSWSGPGITQGSNTSSPTIHSGGSYSVTVTNPANDCFTNAMVNVTADQTLPDLIADDFKHIPCLEATTFISGSSSTPEVSYQWSGPGIVSGANTNQAVVSKGGLYILTVTGKNGCQTSDTVDVFRDVPFTFIADITPTACPEIGTGSIEININGGQAPFSYSWSDGSTTLFLKELYSDEYMLTVTDALGCEIDSLFFVPEDKFYATAYQNAVVDLGDSLQLFVESNISTDDILYSWSPATYLSCTDCEMPFTTPLGDVTYTLFATDTNGCTSSSSVEITLRNTFELHFPTAFTPNGDGLNEIFRALGDTDKTHSYYMSVYNRWNEKIFETRDILQGWTGKQKGDFDYTEAFIYYVSTTFITGESKEYKGSVVVLK